MERHSPSHVRNPIDSSFAVEPRVNQYLERSNNRVCGPEESILFAVGQLGKGVKVVAHSPAEEHLAKDIRVILEDFVTRSASVNCSFGATVGPTYVETEESTRQLRKLERSASGS